MNRSHIKNGFTNTGQNKVSRLPRRPVAAAVNTTVTTRCDNHFRERVGRVLVISEHDFQVGDGPDSAKSTCTVEEQNIERLFMFNIKRLPAGLVTTMTAYTLWRAVVLLQLDSIWK